MKNLFSPSKILLITAFLLFTATVSFAQEEDAPPASRSITSSDFQTQRPKTTVNAFAGKPATAVKSAKRRKNIAALGSVKRRYKYIARVAAARPSTPKRKPSKVKPVYVNEKLGVTFWRLRPSHADEDDAPTFPVENGKRRENWTAERVSSTTKFKKGDRVRFTIESPSNGYIYVVNREFYSDGVTGKPLLIYPTLKAGGDNKVTQGTVIEIPQKNDIYSYFKVDPEREDYAGEELYVIISPTKLPNIKLNLAELDLPEKTLNKWLDDWSGTVDVYDAEDGDGVAYTETEAEAVSVKTRSLRLSEPSPQTIYNVRHLKNQPIVVPFKMNATLK